MSRAKSRARTGRQSRNNGGAQADGRTLDSQPIVGGRDGGGGGRRSFCALPPMRERVLGPDVMPARAALINVLRSKWLSGTVLHYYFFDQRTDGEDVFFTDGTKEFRTWTSPGNAQKDVVRAGFKAWKDVGIGLEFQEVASRGEAEIRIGFMEGDGAWSYIGRDVLTIGASQRTMNFGWDLTRPGEIDTAIHEIGHTLGFPHEHQNPNAGIIWDEEAVYASLAKPPNSWSRDKTLHNIIRKLDPGSVRGSNWDPDSVMHYPFERGLIKEPARFRAGLNPAGGLSAWDRTYVKEFYPPVAPQSDPELKPFESARLSLRAGQQANYSITPAATRNYMIQTFGVSDTVIALFEDDNGNLRYRMGDDDSGVDRNASLRVKLFQGRRYVLRVRLYYSDSPGDTSVMMW